MYRVMLRISKVGLRIKQNIEVQLAIKKHNQSYMLEMKGRLDKCIAEFNAQTQFFITTNDPTFSIYVMIVHGNGRKLAGVCNINLIKFNENSNNQIHQRLEQSPDAEAYIIFQFVYMTTGYTNIQKQLINTSQIEYNKQKEMAKEMQDRNSQLDEQNNRLDLQLKSLQKDNFNLASNKNQMNDYYQKNLQNYQIKMEKKTQQVQKSQNNIIMMRQKIEKARELVNRFGDTNVKARIQQIFKEQ